MMQGAAFAVCTHPHRGVIYPEVWSLQQPTVQLATLQKLTTRGCLIAGFILVLLWTSRQITLRCGLAMGCQVIGKASSPHDDATDYLDCRSVVKRQFRSGFRHVLS